MTRAAIEDHVPVVDIGPFRTGSPEDKSPVAQEVDDACRGIGFLIVSGQGVPADLIQRMNVVCREFIALPYWENARLTMSTDRYRGYLPMGSEGAAYSMEEERRPHDLRECFINGPFDHAYDEYHHGTGGAARASSRPMCGRTSRKAFAPHGKSIIPSWNGLAPIS